MIQQKYYPVLEFSCYVVAIFLFLSFIITAVLGVFAIGVHEKMTVTNYFILLGEVFIGRWFFHIPGIVLIIIGVKIKQKYK